MHLPKLIKSENTQNTKYDTINKLHKLNNSIKILVIIKIWFHVMCNIASLPEINIHDSLLDCLSYI